VGSGGLVVLSGGTLKPAVISGFAAGDEVEFSALTYSAGDSATVKSAGIVTVSAGGTAYNIHIAGAVVGSTAFEVTSASSTDHALVLIENLTSASMAFVAPPAVAALPAADFAAAGPAHAGLVPAGVAGPVFAVHSAAMPAGALRAQLHHGWIAPAAALLKWPG
jgi:hypothetical protein